MKYILFTSNESRYAVFENIQEANVSFVNGSALDSVISFVEQNGYYVCNEGDYVDADFGKVVKVFLDFSFTPQVNSTYEENEYKRYKEQAYKLIFLTLANGLPKREWESDINAGNREQIEENFASFDYNIRHHRELIGVNNYDLANILAYYFLELRGTDGNDFFAQF